MQVLSDAQQVSEMLWQSPM